MVTTFRKTLNTKLDYRASGMCKKIVLAPLRLRQAIVKGFRIISNEFRDERLRKRHHKTNGAVVVEEFVSNYNTDRTRFQQEIDAIVKIYFGVPDIEEPANIGALRTFLKKTIKERKPDMRNVDAEMHVEGAITRAFITTPYLSKLSNLRHDRTFKTINQSALNQVDIDTVIAEEEPSIWRRIWIRLTGRDLQAQATWRRAQVLKEYSIKETGLQQPQNRFVEGDSFSNIKFKSAKEFDVCASDAKTNKISESSMLGEKELSHGNKVKTDGKGINMKDMPQSGLGKTTLIGTQPSIEQGILTQA